jgi:F0F1-type ATP synthase beta subunit
MMEQVEQYVLNFMQTLQESYMCMGLQNLHSDEKMIVQRGAKILATHVQDTKMN